MTEPTIRDIPDLLHDARLCSLSFDSESKCARFGFLSLRRAPDGTQVSDPIVELQVSNLSHIAAYYDAAGVGDRFEGITTASEWSPERMERVEFDHCECRVTVNSKDEWFMLETAARVDWLVGGRCLRDNFPEAVFLSLHLRPESYAPGIVTESLLFVGDEIEIRSGGSPLPLGEWVDQYNAWWEGWQDYWDKQDSSDSSEQAPSLESAIIPAGEPSLVPENFRPPERPAFLVLGDVAAEQLLAPIRDYVEGIIHRDWRRVASAKPNFDQNDEERASSLAEQHLGDQFGRWVYLRELDEFWQEGDQASVTLRGVEFIMADEDDPAESCETVVTYDLRRFDGRWVIRSYSQGWPEYGSAPATAHRPAWLGEWERVGDQS